MAEITGIPRTDDQAIRDTEMRYFGGLTSGSRNIDYNLNLNGLNITDLTGLEYATSLRHLSLDNNLVTDISPLANLTLLKNSIPKRKCHRRRKSAI